MRKLLIALSLLLPSPALAQTAAPYAPITLSEQDYTSIMAYLNDQPAKIANPLMNLLNQMEQKAQATAATKIDSDKPTSSK